MEELGIKTVDSAAAVAAAAAAAPSEKTARAAAASVSERDLYDEVKRLEAVLRSIAIEEEYVKEEYQSLQRELAQAQEEVKRIKSVPLLIGQFLEMIDANHAIVGSTTGANKYVRILSTIDRELLKPSASVALHRHSAALVDVLPPEADSTIQMMTAADRPDVTYQDIGNCDIQKLEMR